MKSYIDGWMLLSKSDKPICRLLNIRSEAYFLPSEKYNEIRNDPLFLKIPSFSLKSINLFINSINQGNSIKISLELMKYSQPFSITILSDIFVPVNSKLPISDAQILLFLFNCLSFIANSSCNIQVEHKIIYFQIFTVLSLIAHSYLSIFACDIFKEITEKCLKELSSNEFDLSILNLILEHLVMNQYIDSSMSPLIIQILTKCVLMRNNDLIESTLSVIVMLFEDKRKVIDFDSKDISHLNSLLTEHINNLKRNALLILGYCSQKAPNESSVSDSFKIIPSLIFTHISHKREVCFKRDAIIKSEVSDSENPNADEIIEQQNDDDLFQSPSEELIWVKDSMLNLIDGFIQNLSSKINGFISLSDSKCVEIFVSSLIKLKKDIIESEYELDLVISLLCILPSLAKKSSIDTLIQVFIESSVFSPSYTIFNKGGLNSKLNTIRDSIINTFSDIDSTLFVFLLESAMNFPFLFAEDVMRLSYKYGNNFFKNPSIIYSILCSLNMLQQMKSTRSKVLAQNIILSVVFSILDDNDVSFICFSDESFCMSFMSLLFISNMTEIAINLFGKCVSKMDYLPDTTINLVSTLLKTCCTKSFLSTNESKEEQQQIKLIAKQLVKSLISAMSHNLSIGNSISPIFDNTLTFLTEQSTQNNETLEMTLMICALLTQSQKSIEVNNKRFNMILDVLNHVEKNEPSDSTFLSLQNQMNASSNITLEQMFIIQAPMVIPIILAAFSQSTRLNAIITMFSKLAHYSVRNIVMSNEGDLCYILLKALKEPFLYKGRKLDFFIDEKTTDDILELVCFITSIQSTVPIDNTFLSLILPHKNPNDNGKSLCFNKNAEKAASYLHRSFSSYDKNPFQICTDIPVFEVNNMNGSNFSYSFAFCFNAKVDIRYTSNFIDGQFVFLRVSDNQNHILEIFQQQESFIARYECGKLRTSAPLKFSIPSNKWIFISCFFMRESPQEISQYDSEYNENNKNGRTICYFKFNHHMSDDIIFRNMEFDKEVKVSIGLTHNVTILPDDISPVSMSNFALILPPYEDKTFDTIASNGFSELNIFENIGFTNNSKNVISKNLRKTLNIYELMPLHVKPSKFNKLFIHSSEISRVFIETALDLMFMTTNNAKRITSLPVLSILNNNFSFNFENNDNNSEIDQKIKQSFGFPNFKFSKSIFDQNYCSHRMSEISSILSNFIQTDFCSDPAIFSILLKIAESSSNVDIQIEIIENFILNIWFWNPLNSSSDKSNINNVKKIIRNLRNFLIEFKFPEIDNFRIFSEFLVQTYFYDSTFHKILETLPIYENDIEILSSLILYISMKNYNECDNKIQIEEKVLSYLKTFNSILTSKENLNIPIIYLACFAKYIPRNMGTEVIRYLVEIFLSLKQNSLIKNHLMTTLALNSKDNLEINQSSFHDYLSVFCINAIRTGNIDDLINQINLMTFKDMNSIKYNNFENWQFWLTFTAVSLSSEVIIAQISVILDSIVDISISDFIENFVIIICYFEIIRSLPSFKHVIKLKNSLIEKVLDNFIHKLHILSRSSNNNSATPNDSHQNLTIIRTSINLALLAFYTMFHKYKREGPSKKLLSIENPTQSSIKKQNGPYMTIKNKSTYYSITDYDFYSLKTLNLNNNINFFIFQNTFSNYISSNPIKNFKMRFWASHTNKINEDILKKILDLLNYPQKEIENLPIIKVIKQFIYEYIKNREGKMNHLLSFEIFSYFSVKENNISNKYTSILNNICYPKIYQLLEFLKKDFDYIEVFERNVSTELQRIKLLITQKYQKQFPKPKIQNNVSKVYHFWRYNPARFLKFPFPEKVPKIKFFSSSTNIPLLSFLTAQISSDDLKRIPATESFYCKLVNIFSDPIDATLHILKNEFQISSYFINIHIPFKEVRLISICRSNCIEIFHEGCSSYFLSLSQRNFLKFKAFNFPFPVISGSENNINDIVKLFIENNPSYIPMFDIIIALNIVSGRSFNDTSFFPMIPIILEDSLSFWEDLNISEYEKIVNYWVKLIYDDNTSNQHSISWKEFIKNAISSQGSFSPTFYSVYDNFINVFNDKTASEMSDIIYSMKKKLECSNKISRWINAFFDLRNKIPSSSETSNNMHLHTNISKSFIKFPKHIVKASFFENSNDSLAVLFNNGKLEVVSIHDNSMKKLKRFLETFNVMEHNSNNHLHLVALKNYIILYDSIQCIMYKISVINYSNIEEIPFSVNITSNILSSGDKLFFIANKTMIASIFCDALSSVDSLPNNLSNCMKILHSEKYAAIELFSISSKYDAIAFYTTEGNIKVISSKIENSLISTITVDEKCLNLLFTEENGFIVINTQNKIIISTINGVILKTSKLFIHNIIDPENIEQSKPANDSNNSSKFVNFENAISKQRVDIVYFIDAANNLCNFEAFKPESLSIISKNISKIVTMKFNSKRNLLYLITESGEIIVQPAIL